MTGSGAQIFISHSSADRASTKALIELLRARDFDSVFVDFDPVDGIPPGRNWERELYLALRRSDAVVAIDSKNWRASQWCFAEIALARSLGKTVIVVRAGKAPAASGSAQLASDAQQISIRGFTESSLGPLFMELRRLEIGALRTFRWIPSRPPYAGLTPLQEEDAGVFFGRRDETRAIIDLAERAVKYGEIRMILLVGASGCGKSSLMRAGVVPQLRLRKYWRVLGPDTVENVARKFGGAPKSGVTVLAVDQIDEELSVSGGADLERIVHQAVKAKAGRCLILGTLRTESLAAFDNCARAALRFIEKVVVGPVTRAGFREIIERPAEVAGGSVEPALVDALLGDLGSFSDVLPLLAVMLRQLWEQRNPRQELTLSTYERMERLRGVIARTAKSIMVASRLTPEDLDALRRAFLGMVRIAPEGRFGRRPLEISVLTARQREVLGRFVQEGLLVTGGTAGAIELAHVALIRTWPLLASWVKEGRKELLRVERFERALAQWRENPSAILEGIGLAEAEDLAQRGHPVCSSADALELLRTSRDARDEALARERERQHVIRVSESLRLASEAREASSVEPETAFLVAWEAVLNDPNELTERVFRETLTRLPLPVSILNHPTRAMYTTGFAGNFAFAADRDSGWVYLWKADGELAGRFRVPGNGPTAACVAEGSDLLIYRDQTARFYDCQGALKAELKLAEPFEERSNWVGISAAANGTYLIHSHGRAWILELTAAGAIHVLRSIYFAWSAAHPGGDLSEDAFDGPLHPPLSTVYRAPMNAEGTRIVTEGSDSARVWTSHGDFEFKLGASERTASAAMLTGGQIVIGTQGGAGYLYDEQGQQLATLKSGGDGRDFFVKAVDSSGSYFASCINQTGIIEIWDADGDLVSTLKGHDGHAWSAEFSPDGAYLATGGADRTVRVWDWRQGRCLFELHGHTGTVHQVHFYPQDPVRLLSACHEGEVRLWTIDAALVPPLRGHTKPVARIVNTAAGVLSTASNSTAVWDAQARAARWLAGSVLDWTGGPGTAVTVLTVEMKRVRLWRLEAASPAACLCEAEAWLPPSPSDLQGILSHDGTRFLLLCASGYELRSDDGELVAVLAGKDPPRVEQEQGRKRWAGFRSDGGSIVTADNNGGVWLWNANGDPAGRFVADSASPDRLLDMALDPRGEYIATGIRNETGLWTWGGESRGRLTSSGYKVQTVRFTLDGSRIVTIADNPSGGIPYVELWERGGRRLPMPGLPEPGYGILFDPHSRYFCIESAGCLTIVDVNGELLGTLAAAHGTYLRDVAISVDGNRVAALFSDGKARFWDFDTRRRTGTLEIGPANRILFTSNSSFLLAAMPEGPIEQHPLDLEYLFTLAARRIDRALTPAEVSRFAVQQPLRLDLHRYRGARFAAQS
jgi:WD40 repeat protein